MPSGIDAGRAMARTTPVSISARGRQGRRRGAWRRAGAGRSS
jgi:hypothetical protein